MSSKTVRGKDLSSLENLNLSLWMLFLMLPGMLSLFLFCFVFKCITSPPFCSFLFQDSLCKLTACSLQRVVQRPNYGCMFCWALRNTLRHANVLMHWRDLAPEVHLFPWMYSFIEFIFWTWYFSYFGSIASLAYGQKTQPNSTREPSSNKTLISKKFVAYAFIFTSFLLDV